MAPTYMVYAYVCGWGHPIRTGIRYGCQVHKVAVQDLLVPEKEKMFTEKKRTSILLSRVF